MNDSTVHEPLGLAVAVNVYKESCQQLRECFVRISSNLHGAKVLIILNGFYRPEVIELAQGYGFMTHCGENFGTNQTWHLWWLRMLDFFSSTMCNICLKLDPDTMVDRTPTSIPDASYFGDVHYNSDYDLRFVQGGITGLAGQAVHRILDSQLLIPGPDKAWFTVQLQPDTALADDQLIAAALRHLGIFPIAWPECSSRWRQAVLNSSLEYAIVHPRYY